MTPPDFTYIVHEQQLDLARRACQLSSARMVRTHLATGERYVIRFDGRHADEAASLFIQMILKRDDLRP